MTLRQLSEPVTVRTAGQATSVKKQLSGDHQKAPSDGAQPTEVARRFQKGKDVQSK